LHQDIRNYLLGRPVPHYVMFFYDMWELIDSLTDEERQNLQRFDPVRGVYALYNRDIANYLRRHYVGNDVVVQFTQSFLNFVERERYNLD